MENVIRCDVLVLRGAPQTYLEVPVVGADIVGDRPDLQSDDLASRHGVVERAKNGRETAVSSALQSSQRLTAVATAAGTAARRGRASGAKTG